MAAITHEGVTLDTFTAHLTHGDRVAQVNRQTAVVLEALMRSPLGVERDGFLLRLYPHGDEPSRPEYGLRRSLGLATSALMLVGAPFSVEFIPAARVWRLCSVYQADRVRVSAKRALVTALLAENAALRAIIHSR